MPDRTGSTDRGVRGRLGRGLVVLLAAGGLVAIPGTSARRFCRRAVACLGVAATIVDLREGAVVEGTDGRDVILVGAAASVHGGKGDDIICGTGKIYGGDGSDASACVTFLRWATSIRWSTNRSEAPADYIRGSKHVDYLTGGPGRDSLAGEGDADVLVGGADQDYLAGGGGDDRLWGGDSMDDFQGGQGQDTLVGGHGYDRMLGGLGDDRMRGEFSNDRLFGGPGVDQARGGPGDLDRCHSETMYSCEELLPPTNHGHY